MVVVEEKKDPLEEEMWKHFWKLKGVYPPRFCLNFCRMLKSGLIFIFSGRLLQSKVILSNIKIANIFKDAITTKKNGETFFSDGRQRWKLGVRGEQPNQYPGGHAHLMTLP